MINITLLLFLLNTVMNYLLVVTKKDLGGTVTEHQLLETQVK